MSDPSRAGVPLHTLVLGHLPEQSVLVGMCAASGTRSLRVGARASSRANATPSDRALPVTPAANFACSSSGWSVARTLAVRSAQNCGEAEDDAEGAQWPSGAVMSSSLQALPPWGRGVAHSVVSSVLASTMLSTSGAQAGSESGPGWKPGWAWVPRTGAPPIVLPWNKTVNESFPNAGEFEAGAQHSDHFEHPAPSSAESVTVTQR